MRPNDIFLISQLKSLRVATDDKVKDLSQKKEYQSERKTKGLLV